MLTTKTIAQIARIYDIPYHEVEKINKLYPDTFYKELGNFIKQRTYTKLKKIFGENQYKMDK